MDMVAPVSPRDLVNASMPPAKTEDFTMGSRIFLNAEKGFAPRVMATSSYDESTSSMAPVMFLTTRGYVNATWPSITRSSDMESNCPKLPQKRAREKPRAVVGIIRGTFTSSSNMRLRREFLCLAICIATGIPNRMSNATAAPAIRNETPMDENSES